MIYDDYFSAIYTIILYGGMLFFALCMYIYINPALLLFVAAAGVIPLVLPRLLDKRLKQAKADCSEVLGSYTSNVSDTLRGVEIIHQFAAVPGFAKIHDQKADQTSSAENKFEHLFASDVTLIMITHDIHGKFMDKFNKKYELIDGKINFTNTEM